MKCPGCGMGCGMGLGNGRGQPTCGGVPLCGTCARASTGDVSWPLSPLPEPADRLVSSVMRLSDKERDDFVAKLADAIARDARGAITIEDAIKP